MLLVLDNFEHVLDGRSLIQELLESAPGLTILTTSRERLNLQSEVLCNLGSMRTAEWKTVEEALAYGAVQLFVQGARRARSGFTLAPEDIGGLSRICRLVEGLPLAIVLAAAWIDTLSVDEIAAEIGKSSSFLETELHDVPERQRSIRSVVDSTWRRLEPAEQELFARLSVFRSSFSREAAQKVARASLRALARLLAKSLLTRDAESGRYHVHELLRQYGEEQLELSSETSWKAREAHAAFFASFMEERWAHLKDHRTAAALSEIKDEIENVRAAWRYWLFERNPKQLRKFFESFWLAHETWGWFRPAIDLFREAASSLADGDKGPVGWESVRAYALAEEGWFTSLVGSPDVGITMARESLELLRHLHEDLYLPTSSVNINAIFLNLLDEADTSSREMLESARRPGDPWQEAFAFIWIAYNEIFRGRLAEAQKLAEDSLATFERLQSAFGIAVAAGIVLGEVHMAQGHFENARQAYEKGLKAAGGIGYRRVVQMAHDRLGTIALREGRIDDAHAIFLTSLRITFDDGQAREQLGSLRDVATIYKLQGHLEKAVELLAVVLNHPARDQNSAGHQESLKNEAERLIGEIETMLSAERYKSAWERGKSFELGHVVAGLLKESQDTATGDLTVSSTIPGVF
jgi:tetratricopeptide (TPR) repeat protein